MLRGSIATSIYNPSTMLPTSGTPSSQAVSVQTSRSRSDGVRVHAGFKSSGPQNLNRTGAQAAPHHETPRSQPPLRNRLFLHDSAWCEPHHTADCTSPCRRSGPTLPKCTWCLAQSGVLTGRGCSRRWWLHARTQLSAHMPHTACTAQPQPPAPCLAPPAKAATSSSCPDSVKGCMCMHAVTTRAQVHCRPGLSSFKQ